MSTMRQGRRADKSQIEAHVWLNLLVIIIELGSGLCFEGKFEF